MALGFFALWMATMGSYVFGAVWHDRGLMSHPHMLYPKRSRRKPPKVEDEDEEEADDDDSKEKPNAH